MYDTFSKTAPLNTERERQIDAIPPDATVNRSCTIVRTWEPATAGGTYGARACHLESGSVLPVFESA